jgi:hypothetical protein
MKAVRGQQPIKGKRFWDVFMNSRENRHPLYQTTSTVTETLSEMMSTNSIFIIRKTSLPLTLRPRK